MQLHEASGSHVVRDSRCRLEAHTAVVMRRLDRGRAQLDAAVASTSALRARIDELKQAGALHTCTTLLPRDRTVPPCRNEQSSRVYERASSRGSATGPAHSPPLSRQQARRMKPATPPICLSHSCRRRLPLSGGPLSACSRRLTARSTLRPLAPSAR